MPTAVRRRPRKSSFGPRSGPGCPWFSWRTGRFIVPTPPLFERVVVGSGLDVADAWIAERVAEGDLVVSADIPLAAKVVEKGGVALSPHGEIFDPETVGERLSVRNFMQELRSGGVTTGGPAPFSSSDRERFANALNRLLLRKGG